MRYIHVLAEGQTEVALRLLDAWKLPHSYHTKKEA